MPEMIIAILTFPVIVMILAVFIVAARSALVATGDVEVDVNDRERLLPISVGRTLLAGLADHGLFLPSACGGRGTCGQCRVKVIEGGGGLLPTERALVTPAEAAAHQRLACQLVVKQPLRIRVPAEIIGIERYECVVRSNRNVATFIKELVLDLPSGQPLEFRAGNYVQIEAPPYQVSFEDFEIDEVYRAEWDRLGLWRYRSESDVVDSRAYSLANYPGEGNELILNVRIATPPADADGQVPPGIVSSFLFSLTAGDRVALTGPFGEFVAAESDREMVFVGGGAGMAPMRSHILDQLLRLKTGRMVSFWYGARSLGELFYAELFDELAERFDNFTWHVALSDPLPEDDWDGPTGFIHDVLYDQYLSDHPMPERCEYYVCGPPVMNQAVIGLLEDLGVEDEQIAFDDFGSAAPPPRRDQRRAG
ncbi:MAG: NADH:ubiquinone reductase (Na(+)-transporting) subunit F [Pseudomonadales bacterium]